MQEISFVLKFSGRQTASQNLYGHQVKSMSKLIIYGCIFAFVILFVLGFVSTPWLCLASFFFLFAGALLLIYKRHIKK